MSFLIAFMIFLNWIERGVERRDENSSKSFNEMDAAKYKGYALMKSSGCFACHRIDNIGSDIGPKLNGVGQRRSREDLFKWIKSPWSIKPGTKMPKYNFTDEQIHDIINYLETKK